MPAYNVNFPTLPPASAKPVSGPAAVAGATDSGGSFFSELWDIINPLQHVPVVGTIYRAITGEHVDSFAQVAGGALYGGMWGAIGAAADAVFEALTGKSAEDTVLAWFEPSHGASNTAATRVAANLTAPRPGVIAPSPLPALPQQTAAASLPLTVPPTELAALTSALADKGVTGQTAQRALYAYQQSMLLTDGPFGSVLASR